MRHTKNAIHLVCALLVVGGTAHASWNKCPNGQKLRWKSGVVSMRLNATSFFQSPDATAAVASAIHEMNWTGSAVKYTLQSDTGDVGWLNGQNEIWRMPITDPDIIAWTGSWYWEDDCTFAETDIWFDTEQKWYPLTTNKKKLTAYGGPGLPLASVAIHELGHAQGDGHTADKYCVMGGSSTHVFSNGDDARFYPGEYLTYQSIKVYGKTTKNANDLGVVHWRHTGHDKKGYSTHGRCRVADKSLNVLTGIWKNGEPLYYVYPGQVVRAEFSFENRGKETTTAGVGWYYSSDDHVWTSDQLLATKTFNFGVDKVGTKWSPNLTVPLTAVPGTRALGAVVDFDSKINEPMEKNNATYTHVLVLTPDLRAVSISGPKKKKLKPGDSTVSVTIDVDKKNWGGKVPWEIRLSKNQTIGSKDKLLASGSTTNLAPQTIVVDLSGVKKGKYYWGLRLLAASHEDDLQDNTVTGNKIKITKKKK